MRRGEWGRLFPTCGKIERLNRTLEDELLRGLPRWTGGPRDRRGQLVGEAPLTLERFSYMFADYVERYNIRRGHVALGGRTPLEVWRSDSTPVERVTPEQARWMLRAREEHVINKDGIHHRRRVYYAPELNGLAGGHVEIAFMPHDLRTVDVYVDGQFLATAVDQERLADDERRAALAADATAIRKRAAKARRAARLRIAPITTPGEIDELGTPPGPAPPPTDPGVLRLLGRDELLNQAREDRPGR